ncbi:hypothetical protein Bbelb_261090 [Branchiostoma belcheri]|nr:hypothetical protein Bbelb_261090 [Branchiostoma belcheri]
MAPSGSMAWSWGGQSFHKVAADLYRSEDYCLNLSRQIGPEDLKTKEESQVCPEGRLFWEKPVDLKMQKEMKTVGTVVIVNPKTGLQHEEEPDFCRQGCMKENGEVCSCPDWEKPVMTGDFCTNQTKQSANLLT